MWYLRVDRSAAPLPTRRTLWEAYAPQAEDFLQRANDPGEAPIF